MRLPLIPTLFVAAAVATMIGLGIWQLQRAAWKEALLADYGRGVALPASTSIRCWRAGGRLPALCLPPRTGDLRRAGDVARRRRAPAATGRTRPARPIHPLPARRVGGCRADCGSTSGWAARPDAAAPAFAARHRRRARSAWSSADGPIIADRPPPPRRRSRRAQPPASRRHRRTTTCSTRSMVLLRRRRGGDLRARAAAPAARPDCRRSPERLSAPIP